MLIFLFCFHSFSKTITLLFFRYLQKKVQHFLVIPNPNEFFKPLHQNYGGNFKVRKNKTHSSGIVCNFQIGPAGAAQEGTFSTSGPCLMGLSPKGFLDMNDSVCRGFRRLFVFHLSYMMWVDICITARPVPPLWKIPWVHLSQIFDLSFC